MTHETYENLMRVIERRIRQAMIAGNHKDLNDACAEKIRLQERFRTDNAGG